MKPSLTTNVLDKNGGFHAETKGRRSGTCTLWRPGHVIGDPTGVLQSFDEHSFYQMNNDVTIARYKVKGYRYPVLCWFDNKTGERIA